MRGFLAKLCKKNGIAKRIVSMSLALLMVLSTLQALPAGILVAHAAEDNVTLHFDNAKNWTTVNAYVWDSGSTAEGYSVWPGKAITDTDGDGWYDADLGTISSAGNINMVFNNKVGDVGVQTANIVYNRADGVTDLWVFGGAAAGNGTVTTEKPGDWSGDITIHADAAGLDAYIWHAGGDLNGSWDSPEKAFAANQEGHDGWYDLKLGTKTVTGSLLYLIMKNSEGQSPDCAIILPEGDAELWVTGGTGANSSTVTTTAPASWNSDVKSPVVEGNKVTFTYVDTTSSIDTLYLRGDMNSWGKTEFETKNGNVFTHEETLTPGTYAYKFWYGTGDGNWPTDSLNSKYDSNGNNLVIVSGMYSAETLTAEKGKDFELPATLKYVDTAGTESTKNVTYALKDSSDANVSLTNGKLNVAASSDLTSVDLIATATEDNTLTTAITVKLNEAGVVVLKSPVVEGNKVTFTYEDKTSSIDTLYLRGDMNGWGKTEFETKNGNVFTHEETLTPGTYAYKFWYGTGDGNWPTDSLNSKYDSNGNNLVIVSGMYSAETLTAEKGKDFELPTTLKYVDTAGTESPKNVTYALKDSSDANVTLTDGKLNVAAASDLTSVDLIATATDNTEITVTITVKLNEAGVEVLKSPVVNGNQVTFNYEHTSSDEVTVRLTGSFLGWSGEGPVMTKAEDRNVYSTTYTLTPGQYTYKFIIGSNWFADPLNNAVVDGDGNSILVVPGLYAGSPIEAKKGENFALPTSLDYMDASGNASTKPVTYALKNDENSSFVTITNGTTLKATAGCEETAVDLIATATDGSNEIATVTVSLVDQIYTYTVYAYSPIADRVNVNNAALYIWDKAGETSLEKGDHAFTATEVLDDNKTWLKAEIQLSCAQSIGFIMKSKGADVWNWQTADLIFANTAKTDQTIYLVDGFDKVYTSLDEVPEISQLCIEYTRSDNSYTNPYVEIWNNGYSYKEQGSVKNYTYNFDNSTGKYIVNIPVALGTKDKTVGFNIYNGDAIDGTSNTVTIPAGEKLTKVKYNNGVITIVPDSAGYVADRANNKISFYYRDEALFAQNKMHTIAPDSVYLAIRTAEGTGEPSAEDRIKMTYDANDERFELENQELKTDSDVYYYYVVGSNSVLDAKNDRTATLDGVEYCMVRNRVYSINLSASVKYSDMTYDDGNVLYVSFDDVEGFNPEKITVDLSSLGLGSKVEMDKELKALSFGCLEGTSVGTKAIKVTLTDDCDVSYTANATVNVKARTKTANTSSKLGTFDWDEAVIYFAITDRFFDGNSSNNTGDPNSTADDAAYNPEDAGSYHGGDFAGLTQKINYLYDLGVNTIWLTPIVDNVDINCDNGEKDDCDYYAYHGYWASDFTKLNPHLGTDAELKALINAAHAKGMKIMVDVVINHGGYGEEDTFNNIIPGMVRDAGNMEAGDIKASLSGLPDFMTEDPEVRKQLIDWQTYWMTEYDIDYYRVDTVKHVENTTWNAFKNALVEQNQDFKLIGEYYDAGYLNDFDQLDTGRMDSVLDFNFNDLMARLVDEDLAGIESELGRRNTMLTNTATVGSFTSSHDEDGLLYTMTQKENDATWAEALMKVAATYQATAKGQPVIYYGEEIGLTGQNNWPYYTNRPDFDWTEQATQAATADSMYNHYKKVLNIRRNYSEVFAKGTRTAVVTDSGEGYEVFSRSYEGKTLYVGVNVWGDARETTFYVAGAAGSVYKDLYSGKTYTVAADGSLTISIPGAQDGGTAILVGTGVTVTDTNEITVKVHYTRNDGDYEGWNLWAWTEGVGGAQYDFVKEGNDMVATVSGLPGRTTTSLWYLTRLNEWKEKDYEEDQYVDLSDVVSGTVHYYINSSSYGGTRVLGGDAIVGSKIVGTSYNRNTNVVTVNMSTPISGSALEAFTIKCSSTDTKIDIESVEKNGNQYFLTLEQDISSMEALLLSYTITYDGYTYNLMTPNVYSSEEFEDAYTYTGKDLGLTYTASASTFKLWAPTADSVTLNIYTSGTKGTADLEGSYTMTGGTKAEKGVWTYVLDGDWNGKYYTYTVNVANKVNELCDPYARTTGVNGNRAMILNLDSTDPEGWAADKTAKRHDDMKQTDAVIYELHVRDLSIDSSSGVDSKYQGKFLGLTQTGTTTAGGNPTALDHMINLGITHLHLIPVYDYGSVNETKLDTPQFNWGYDPVNYNVPEGSYSTNPYDGSVRVAEMKQMIKTLHDNNINVVMDVVYNHVYDADSFAFNQAVPKYFSRTKEDGTYSSRSGCGNDTASERSMVHKYIVDSILYWHDEYHIDGFRFDLVGLIDTVTINKIVADVHAIDPDIIFYGEGWNMDDTVMSKDGYDMAKQDNASKTPGFAYFSDNIRNGIAGSDVNGEGYIWGHSGKDSLVSGLTLARSSWSTNPSQVINYVSCHDNYTLMDKINVVSKANVTSYNYTPGEYQVALNNLAAATYMFSEGIPLVHAGEDFLRIKLDESGKVSHNSYNAPDYVNKLRWSNLDTAIYKDTTDYYKGLIEFRKNHAVLRLADAASVSAYVTSRVDSTGVIVNTFDGSADGEVADEIIIIFNATNAAKTVSIGAGTWQVCVNKENAGTDVLDEITDGSVTVESYSVMALVKGETVDNNSIYDQNNVVTLTLDQTTLTTGIDGVVALKATTSTPATLTWVSDDETIATVDAQGRVTAVAVGNATITVSTYHGVEATCAVTVTDEAVTPTVTVDKTELSLVAGESDTLVITVSPAGTTATYTSSDEAVATIDSTGKVTAVGAGTATVTATLADGTSVSCEVTVTAAPVEEKVTLNAATLSLTPGGSATIVANVTPAGTKVSFSSNDTDVATVDANGKVTAVGEGTAEIIVATAAGKTAICTVTVAKAVAPTPNPVPSKPGSDATTGVGDGAQAGINPGTPTKPADQVTTEDEDQVQVEVETKAETEVPENVTDVTPVVDEKLQDAIANETEKILEDILDDEISDDVMSEETIENVKKAQENGDGIITEVIVDKLDEADVDADVKEALAKALADSVKDKKGAETKIAQYLDLSVLLKTTSGEKLGTINKLSKNTTFTIAVPEDLVKEGRVFVVLRMHEGETTVLETTLNSDGTLSFKTDRFSTYALAYIDAPAEDAKDDEVTEGDVPSGSTTTEEEGGNNFATFIIVGLIIVIIAALVIIFLAMKRKKE